MTRTVEQLVEDIGKGCLFGAIYYLVGNYSEYRGNNPSLKKRREMIRELENYMVMCGILGIIPYKYSIPTGVIAFHLMFSPHPFPTKKQFDRMITGKSPTIWDNIKEMIEK